MMVALCAGLVLLGAAPAATAAVRGGPSSPDSARWQLVRASASPVVGEAQSKRYGIGGFETGSFAKAGATYHAYINELPNQMEWARCPDLWWDATTQLGHWTAPSAFGPWVRQSTVRQTAAAKACTGEFNFSGCDLAEPPSQTW
eukprot:SAG31_NODE_558_length_14153_cov_9.068094_2_plen_144_part_00